MRSNLIIVFLFSVLSGSTLIFLIEGPPYLSLRILLCCLGLVPFLYCTLEGSLKSRLFSFLGFSFPVALYVGEGIWFSMRYYYEIPLFPSILLFLVWVWFLSSLHLLIFSLFSKRVVGLSYERLWLLPFLWVALEYLYGLVSIQARTVFIGIFPPFFSLSTWMARVGGVYAISFAIVFINTLILSFLFLKKVKFFRQRAWQLSLGFFVFLILVGKFYPVKSETLKKPLSLALVQPNLQFPLKEDSASIQRRLDQLLKASQEALSKGVDLVVWPASLLVIQNEEQIWNFLRILEGASPETRMLMGFTRRVVQSGQEFYQSRIYLTDLNGNVGSTYIKQRLTPYTEYIPLGFLDFIGKRKMRSPEYISSKSTDLVFNMGERRWSTPICLEIFYPELLRRFIREGAEFLIHLSNDDVYATSDFKKFLLRISALRALELGVPIFREAIDGYSASLNFHGQIEDVLFSGEEGVLYVKLSEKRNPSLYSRIGDIFSWLCVIIVILIILVKTASFLRKSYSS